MKIRTTPIGPRGAALAALAALFIASACARNESVPPGEANTTTVVTESPTPRITVSAPTGASPAAAPAAEGQSNVRLNRPAAGSAVTENPMTVEGEARTFENAVTIRLLDQQQRLISETHAVAEGEMGSFNPFSARVWITRWPGTSMTVEALEISPKDGSVRSRATAAVRIALPQEKVKLYMPNSRMAPTDCDQVFPLEREFPKTAAIGRVALEALMSGPTPAEKAEGYSNPFPPGSAVESLEIANGVAIVDFNERLKNVGGSCRAQAIRAAVENTLRAMHTVDRVEIRAGGSEAEALQP
ncbi:MAG: Gmad2 immunoglobulin-like domain-containing protein [Thermoanaerobaculia bacterium]